MTDRYRAAATASAQSVLCLLHMIIVCLTDALTACVPSVIYFSVVYALFKGKLCH